jgi:two-component system, OmpR family, phosphate regulon sensor histidine kinase PhoR
VVMPDALSKLNCRTIVAALPDAALIVGHSQVVVAANAAAEEILASELEGQPVAPYLRSPDVLGALSHCLSAAVRDKVELVVRSKIQRTLDIYLAPIGRGETGPLALLVLRDRTREEQVERMRSDFVANASHELRTPLTTLSGFIETMQGAASKDEKARGEFLKLMKAQSERMSGLIDDLLSLSRIELDEHVAPSASVNLTDIVRQTQNLLQSLVRDTGCELEIDLPQQLPVRGDANQLAQVVHNLIENAIKYSGRGKRVFVSSSSTGTMAVLTVRDNGPGIAAHHIPRLTERFYRVNVQDSRTRGGTGLGLAICKHIINRHRGKLLIESDVGHGSVFSIHLPKYI